MPPSYKSNPTICFSSDSAIPRSIANNADITMHPLIAAASVICTLILAAAPSATAVSLPRAPASLPNLAKRQIIAPSHGFTAEPANSSIIEGGADFDFLYYNSNYCHSGYSQISVYLSTSAPTDGDVTNEGGLADGSYVVDFGTYLIANFGESSNL